MKYITAHTPATQPYQPYINVSRHDDMKGVRITVRSPANSDCSCGSVSFIDLSNAEYYKIFLDMKSELDDTNAPASMDHYVTTQELVAHLEKDPAMAQRLREARVRLARLVSKPGEPLYERLMRGDCPTADTEVKP